MAYMYVHAFCKKNVNNYHFVNFVLQFISVHVMAGNIKINKNEIIIIESIHIVFRYTLLVLKIYSIHNVNYRFSVLAVLSG